eukprot:Skav201652  [mRNA]  locus=scaffold3160:200616:203792:+ [translate_table: standard]
MFEWHTASGKPIAPQTLLRLIGEMATKVKFGWDQPPGPNRVKLVKIEGTQISMETIRHNADQTVHDLLHAEQIMQGPKTRVIEARTRFDALLDPSANLSEIGMVVIHLQDSHDRCRLSIHHPMGTRILWVTRGTRIFEFLRPATNQVVIDGQHAQLPLDYPIWGSMSLMVVEKDDESEEEFVTPTLSFVAEPPVANPERTQAGLKVNELIQHNTAEIQLQLARIVERPAAQLDKEKRMWLVARFTMMCEYGSAMGDDEMTHALFLLETALPGGNWGALQWDDVHMKWEPLLGWSNVDYKQTAEFRFVVLYHDGHWTALRVTGTDQCTLTYHSQWDMAPEQITNLCEILQVPETNVVRSTCDHVMVWCGFEALDWIVQQCPDNTPDAWVEQHYDMVFSHLGFMSKPLLARYDETMRTHQAAHPISMRMRAVWIRRMLSRPTFPKYHGLGNLKLAGKLASILIAKGHSDDEATSVGHFLSDHHAAQVKNLPNLKVDRAYTELLQVCIEHKVPLSEASKSNAIKKLQQWFRKKAQQKQTGYPKNEPVNLRSVSFVAKTFMIENGPFIEPSGTWNASVKGFSVASTPEIAPVLQQGKLLAVEYNSVLIPESLEVSKPFTAVTHDIPIRDEHDNHALVRAVIVNMGQKPVVRVPAVNGDISLPASATLILSVYKSQVPGGWWQELIQTPVKHLLRSMFDDQSQKPILQCWSRRWQIGTKQVPPEQAEWFSVLCGIKSEAIQEWLCMSGMTNPPIYVSLKKTQGSEENQDASYRIVWVGKCLNAALCLTGPLTGHFGIIHKPPSFGVRVSKENFEQAWKQLRGKEDVPSMVETKTKWIIEGTPKYLTCQQLEAWAEGLKWPIRVIRRLNDGKFIIGTETKAPGEHMSINGQTLLLKQIHEEQDKKFGMIVAGKYSRPRDKELPLGSETLVDEDMDPWKGAKLPDKKGTSAHHNPWSSYIGVSASSGMQPTREADQLVLKQAARIDEVEKELGSIKEQLTRQQHDTDRKFERLDSNISKVHTDLSVSLQQALKDQSASLVATFEQLLKRSPREDGHRSRSPKVSK